MVINSNKIRLSPGQHTYNLYFSYRVLIPGHLAHKTNALPTELYESIDLYIYLSRLVDWCAVYGIFRSIGVGFPAISVINKESEDLSVISVLTTLSLIPS